MSVNSSLYNSFWQNFGKTVICKCDKNNAEVASCQLTADGVNMAYINLICLVTHRFISRTVCVLKKNLK